MADAVPALAPPAPSDELIGVMNNLLNVHWPERSNGGGIAGALVSVLPVVMTAAQRLAQLTDDGPAKKQFVLDAFTTLLERNGYEPAEARALVQNLLSPVIELVVMAWKRKKDVVDLAKRGCRAGRGGCFKRARP